MRRYVCLLTVMTPLAAGCAPSANVQEEQNKLMTLDREWSASAKDIDKFMSYYAPDAATYPPGMPKAEGVAAIKEQYSKMLAMPGFSISWAPAKAAASRVKEQPVKTRKSKPRKDLNAQCTLHRYRGRERGQGGGKAYTEPELLCPHNCS